uniref:uncharacterized protein LOC101302215 isoform X1 n=1 Tax=Fragaria vesca subsp. vesca TaxID=101020 RepID=UPI0005CA07B9|nr:PREDICTED: uncharacterized protein LOC101302215 isoform X1 [Fragaria vesca subsp. vesca]XP_011469683.1 PREDICTED: uncharacterized protein LOC101302215 isoform X2 [Fragaria vesca subsp. vesca]
MADPEIITSAIDKEKDASNIESNAGTGTRNTRTTTDAAQGSSSAKWLTMKELVDPKGPFIRKWNVIFIASCVFAVLLDPLFLYIPIINEDMKCLRLDNNLKIAALLLRSLTDICYLLNIFLQVYSYKNCSAVRSESFSSNINTAKEVLIDILAVLPIPQVVILNFMCKMKGSGSLTTRKLMNFLVVVQYVPRVFRIYLSCQESKKSSKEEIPIWLKGLLNFFLYILASHIIGAFWYFFAVERVTTCWRYGCRIENGCDPNNLDCRDHHTLRNIAFLDEACSRHSPNGKFFDFGIYVSILQLGILASTNYSEKLSNCFWWGLRNLSSLGSNLQTSVNTWENLFAASISIIGLLLFIYLIGNLQTYMQLETSRRATHRWNMKIHKKMEEKGEAVERWLSNNGIPLSRKPYIMKRVQVELEEERDVDTENIFSILPLAHQKEMRSCMPLNRLKRMPLLQNMDEKVLREISVHLNPEKYNKNDIIIQEDKPLEKMIFIVDGFVKIEMKDYSGDPLELGAGQVYGEKLLTWPAWTSFPGRSNESVRAFTETVEVLVLTASDMETVGSKFRQHFRKRNPPLKEAKWELLTSDLVKLLRKVPIFQRMDSQVLKEISRHLSKSNYSSDSYIIQETHPLDKMFFLVEGSSLSIESSRPCTRESLGVRDFYGEELVHWVINWSSSQTSFPANVPLSTCSVKVPANTVIVEVRELRVHDLRNIFSNNSMTQFMKLPANLPMDVQDKLSPFDPLITWLKQVPNLQNVDEEGLKEICEKFKLMKYNDKSRDIITSGENKFDKMFLIVSGLVRIRKINCDDHYCYSGQHYGDHELFEWVSRTSLTEEHTLPKSDVTVEAVGDVEALVLMADDLVNVAFKFNLQVGKEMGQSQTDPDRKPPRKKPTLTPIDKELEEIEKKLRRSIIRPQAEIVEEPFESNKKLRLPKKKIGLRARGSRIMSSYGGGQALNMAVEEQDMIEEVEVQELNDELEYPNNADEMEMEASDSYNKRRASARQRPSVLKQILRAAVVLDCEEENLDWQYPEESTRDEEKVHESNWLEAEEQVADLHEVEVHPSSWDPSWELSDTSIHTYGKQKKSSRVKSGVKSSKKSGKAPRVIAGGKAKPSHLMQVLSAAYAMDLEDLEGELIVDPDHESDTNSDTHKEFICCTEEY